MLKNIGPSLSFVILGMIKGQENEETRSAKEPVKKKKKKAL